MMDKISDDSSEKEISLLICKYMGINVGIDMAQVSEICDMAAASKKGLGVFHLHEKIGQCKTAEEYKTPRVLIVKKHGDPAGIVVDMPQEIISIPITSIRPLPRLFELFKAFTPVWGLALWQKNIVLLIDLLCLFNDEKLS